MKIRILLNKLARLSSREWRDLFAAQGAIFLSQMSVWLRRRGNLVSAEQITDEVSQDGPIDSTILDLGRAIDRAASFGFIRAECLVRSMALARLMEARGYVGAIVRVGVSRDSEKLLAHAWVEYNGTIVGDDEENISKFNQLPGIDVDV